jgi:hypothetical protein
MAGDPLDDVTRIDWGNTYDTTATTSVDPFSTTTYVESYSYSYSYIQSDEYIRKIKDLIRKALIRAMKNSWNKDKGFFRPLPKLRPSVQLRGVCLSGRGWA